MKCAVIAAWMDAEGSQDGAAHLIFSIWSRKAAHADFATVGRCLLEGDAEQHQRRRIITADVLTLLTTPPHRRNSGGGLRVLCAVAEGIVRVRSSIWQRRFEPFFPSGVVVPVASSP